MQIDRALLDQIVAQAHAEAPNECCGIIATQDGKAVAVHPRHATPPPRRCATRWTAWSSTASRPRSRTPGTSSARSTTRTRAPPPYPSQTDINLAFYPEALYVIVGVAGDEPDVRAFRIVEGEVSEQPLEVVG